MNILLVHTQYRLPGGEDAVFAAERAMLAAHGHAVFTYERSNAELDSAPLRTKLLLPFTAVFSLRTVREVRALIRAHHIEIVHVHNTLLVTSPSVFWACFAEHVPVVQTLHNFRLFCPNGVLLRDGAVCEDCPHQSLWCAVQGRCYRGSRAQSLVCAAVYAIHRWLRTYRRVSLIAVTEFDRQKLDAFNARRRVYDEHKMYVKPHFVTAPALIPLPWAQRRPVVVYAARLQALKGVRVAVAAWNLLAGVPGAPRLLIAGVGEEEPWVRAHAGKNIELLGQIPQQKLYELLAQSQAAVVPSLCYESFALVPAQAHAVGTPVLGSETGNVGASVREGVDGFKFAPGSAAGLAAAVQRLMACGPALDPAAIRARALEEYGPEQNYARLMEIYADVLSGEKQG